MASCLFLFLLICSCFSVFAAAFGTWGPPYILNKPTDGQTAPCTNPLDLFHTRTWGNAWTGEGPLQTKQIKKTVTLKTKQSIFPRTSGQVPRRLRHQNRRREVGLINEVAPESSAKSLQMCKLSAVTSCADLRTYGSAEEPPPTLPLALLLVK